MRWMLLLLVVLLAGCIPGRTTFLVSGQVEGVDVQARYELGAAYDRLRLD
jgi:hypothetical protein